MSTVITNETLGTDELPERSVCVDVTDQSPSTSVPKSHDDTDADATNEHTTDTPLRVAVTVTVYPFVAPATETVGVLSDVTLSVDDEPVSDDATRSGADGAATAATVTDIVDVAFCPTASDTAYVKGPAVPTKFETGSKITSPVTTSSVQTPLPDSVTTVFEQFGATSVPPHKNIR